jgi:hypothetical protein
MNNSGFSLGDEPAIRRAAGDGRKLDGYACPFCGEAQLLLSDGDLPIDTERVEVYCDNGYCAAREIVILVERGDGAHKRADVQALRAVDRGTEAEQEADGATLERDSEGKLLGRAWSYRESRRRRSRGERDNDVLDRRRRNVEVTITPVDDGDE